VGLGNKIGTPQARIKNFEIKAPPPSDNNVPTNGHPDDQKDQVGNHFVLILTCASAIFILAAVLVFTVKRRKRRVSLKIPKNVKPTNSVAIDSSNLLTQLDSPISVSETGGSDKPLGLKNNFIIQ